ncbi:DUF2637 domain-containing protein [Actinokineospora pegani]|uniref:DUF2637 domain-containing protein n=1 Tax=Actinokineospora pegani TaxID=2654637 RepID=UPI0012EA8A2F|nr:DUF2637 domain-containing protein [Actinokineospora pegani]
MSQESALDPAHAVALAERNTIADKIRYACGQVDPPTTHEVRQFLDAYGVTTAQSYATNVIDTWRRENAVGDTGDLVALSPGLLAELDALKNGSADDPSSKGAASNGSASTGAGANGASSNSSTNGSANGAKAKANGPAKAKANGKVNGKANGKAAGTPPQAAPPAESAPAETAPADKDTAKSMDTAVEPDANAGGKKQPAEAATEILSAVDPAKHPDAEAETPSWLGDPARDGADLSWLDAVDDPEVTGVAEDGKAIKGEAADAAAAKDLKVVKGAQGAEAEAAVSKDLIVADAQATEPEPVEPVTAHAQRVAPAGDPEPEPMSTQRMPVVLSFSANMAWIVVLIAAMGISWWSLFEYARGFSIPTPLAAVVSLVFDASALIVAGLAHRYALSPYSGAGPRIALLLLLAGSCYLNWEHAAGKGYGIEASIMFAAPAAVGILLFELHIGWHSRSERRARGRVARSLPVIGAWGWFLHPLQSLTTLWRVTHARGRSVRHAELTSIEEPVSSVR